MGSPVVTRQCPLIGRTIMMWTNVCVLPKCRTLSFDLTQARRLGVIALFVAADSATVAIAAADAERGFSVAKPGFVARPTRDMSGRRPSGASPRNVVGLTEVFGLLGLHPL